MDVLQELDNGPKDQNKSNQSLFVWRFSYKKVAQSALQRFKTEKKKQQIKSREENQKNPTLPPPQTCTETYTNTHTSERFLASGLVSI